MAKPLAPVSERPADVRDEAMPRAGVPGRVAADPLEAAAGVLRVEAKGRSRAPEPRVDAFRLDTENEYLWRGDVPVELAPKAFAVLRYLVEHPGRLVTHRELLEALWPETYVQPEILKTYIRDIRKTLADDPRAPRFIRTRARRGYHFIAAVSHEASAPLTVLGPSPAAGSGNGKRPQAPTGPRRIAIGESALLDRPGGFGLASRRDPDLTRSPRRAPRPPERQTRPGRQAGGVGDGPARLDHAGRVAESQPAGNA
jgi:DNA-binding winged helix-turn-helix (wHTH) protein